MNKNVKLYGAAYHLYRASTFLSEIKEEEKEQILDMAKKFLHEVNITEKDEEDTEAIEKYAEMIKDES